MANADAQLAQIHRETDELFAAYMKSCSPFQAVMDSMIVNDDSGSTSTLVPSTYQIRTLTAQNMARVSLLPMFPHAPSAATSLPHLLLANVPSKTQQH